MHYFVRLVCLSLVLFASACVVGPGTSTYNPPVNGDYYGSQYYDVSEPDYIYDAYGYQAVSDCVGTVQFTGWFDSACDALTSSESTSATLLCGYYDIYNEYYEYYQSFSFPAGYVAEYCTGSGRSSNQQPLLSSNIDPKTQPIVNDALVHAAVEKRKGPFNVKQNLGRNVTIEEFMKKYPKGLKRERTAGSSIDKFFTRQEFNASQK